MTSGGVGGAGQRRGNDGQGGGVAREGATSLTKVVRGARLVGRSGGPGPARVSEGEGEVGGATGNRLGGGGGSR
eukprot:scaffold202693_cov18-Tisochrysis_lutea.AAC.2